MRAGRPFRGGLHQRGHLLPNQTPKTQLGAHNYAAQILYAEA